LQQVCGHPVSPFIDITRAREIQEPLCAGYLIDRGEVPVGYQLATGASVALGAAMLTRYVKTRKVLPSGALAVLGTVSAVYYAVAAVDG
jgi:uncharacterized membrane protein (UPF0136 family)